MAAQKLVENCWAIRRIQTSEILRGAPSRRKPRREQFTARVEPKPQQHQEEPMRLIFDRDDFSLEQQDFDAASIMQTPPEPPAYTIPGMAIEPGP
ncbi:MAG: hypothetical protein IPM35_33610 [Myxococcales bacterium]|nr:hypothetical protein [Myxococcales bacterium]